MRPLLDFRRVELRAYLKEKQQPWREDSTNSELDHTRNSVRHELLPILAGKYNPAIVETLLAPPTWPVLKRSTGRANVSAFCLSFCCPASRFAAVGVRLLLKALLVLD